ncbi:hypothetical protein KL86CLO1_11376 [uncultured Eubacteriales bacterium]|uniref:Histidine kinase n=1 Tax=uncultured Eubacteriales bacterium TaxID=172733 RepID=A0A212JMN4_9FIRM|nr:hypothetical protein KL86CLO1_11376 [uncultured Eubacteriales bacterium]
MILVVVAAAAITTLMILLVQMKSEQPLNLSQEETEYLQSISPIKIAVDPDWEPFERLNDKGEYSGIAADYFKLIEKRLHVRFELVPTSDWSQSLQYSQDGKVMLLSLLNKTPEREKWLIFSDPLIVDDNVIIGRYDSAFVRDLHNEVNKTVVLPAGTSVEERLRTDYPNLSIVLTETEAEAFDMVLTGQADFTIRSLIVAEYNIRGQGWFDLKVIGKIEGYSNYLSIGIAKNQVMLQSILDKAILSITEQEKTDILNRHVPLKVEITNSNRVVIICLIATAVGAVILLIVGFIQSSRARYLAIHNRKIQEITERYEALSELSGTYFWQVDRGGVYSYVSHEVCKVLGFEGNSLLGKHYGDYIDADDMQRYEKTMENAEILTNYEIRHRKKDGTLLWLKVDAMPVLAADGTVLAYRGSSTDIEQRKHLESNLIKAKNEIELAYYQAQIGPHFLYNAMSAIALYCTTEPKKASSLIVDLSFFLRKSYDFKNMDYMVTLEQELELVKAYINIEKVRFQDRLQVIYEIPEELYQQLIPPLILQPLIENAINHGLMKRIEGGTVVICAAQTGNMFQCEVRDDGVGIGETQIQILKDMNETFTTITMEKTEPTSRRGVGLVNIHARLLRRYHKGLTIARNEAGGTTVSFSLPESRKESTI